MDNELNIDPFTRRFTGRGNAFLVRTNPSHLELCLPAIHARRLREVAVRYDPHQPWEVAAG